MFSSWAGKMPWRREKVPTSVFWPGKFHGQRSLAGYSPWGHKESDTTEGLSYRSPQHLKWLQLYINFWNLVSEKSVVHFEC